MTTNALPIDESGEFDAFVRDAQIRLRRALIGAVGLDRVDDAVAEALAWAVEHRDQLAAMHNPVGYLFRVGQSRVRPRKQPRFLAPGVTRLPEVEPGLPAALAALPDTQRVSVWLAHGCAWTHAEIGQALGIAPSTVATHVARAMTRLRAELGVVDVDAR